MNHNVQGNTAAAGVLSSLGRGDGGYDSANNAERWLWSLLAFLAALAVYWYYRLHVNGGRVGGLNLSETERRQRRERLALAAASRFGKGEDKEGVEKDDRGASGKTVGKRRRREQTTPTPRTATSSMSVRSEKGGVDQQRPEQSPTTNASDETPRKKDPPPGSFASAGAGTHTSTPSKEEQEPSEGNKQAASPSPADVKKKKKKRPPVASPSRVLGEALSEIFRCGVVVVVVEEGEPAAVDGEKKKRPLETGVAAVLRLSGSLTPRGTRPGGDDGKVTGYTQSERGNGTDGITAGCDWNALLGAFSSFLGDEELSSKSLYRLELLPENDIRRAAACYGRTSSLIRNGFALVGEGYDRRFFDDAMRTFSGWLTRRVGSWVEPEVRASMDSEDTDRRALGPTNEEEEDCSGLFSDEYNDAVVAAVEKHPRSTGPLESLFLLLEEVETVVSTDFLEALFRCHDDGGGATEAGAAQKTAKTTLANAVFHLALRRLGYKAGDADSTFSVSTVPRRLRGLTGLLASRAVGRSLSNDIEMELIEMTTKVESMNGRDVQALVRLASLFEWASYAVPGAGEERDFSGGGGPFFRQWTSVPDFPLAVFRTPTSRSGPTEASRLMEEARRTMKMARQTADQALSLAFKGAGKRRTFNWLAGIISANRPLVGLLKSDLLKPDGIVGLCSTRRFLLGLASTLVGTCQMTLSSRLREKGAEAFDATYLRGEILHDTNRLFMLSESPAEKMDRNPAKAEAGEFTGATNFFFLSCLALRVSLYPALRMEGEFAFVYQKLIADVHGQARAGKQPPAGALRNTFPVIVAWLGWKTFLEDPDVVSLVTDFTLVQLGWLVEVAKKGKISDLSLIPDWMCREPARWLSHLAHAVPFRLLPRQAERAVEYATTLLKMGTSSASVFRDGNRKGGFSLSPIVVTSLIGIASSFVQAGVHRARNRRRPQQRRGNRRLFGSNRQVPDDELEEEEEEDDDDRNGPELYLSFDQNDLGVTVFTNDIVRRNLCPTLLRTFRAVDAVEGFDADRDDAFSKFSAKSQIAQLLLRLWNHPSGECRESVALLPRDEVLSFGSSLATVAAVDLDFGLGALENVFLTAAAEKEDALRRITVGGRNAMVVELGANRAYIEQCTWQAVGMLLGTRRYLSLLCALSQDDRIASHLGGHVDHDENGNRFLTDLSNMIVHFLERLTSADGGTNASLEQGTPEPTSRIASRIDRVSSAERACMVHAVVERRVLARTEYGLDVGVMCHQLLALAAKWHLAVISKSPPRCGGFSPFLACLASHEDLDLVRIENIYRRLVPVPEAMEGTELDNTEAILEHDGHVDHTTWRHKYTSKGVSEVQKGHRQTARLDQMKHKDIAKLASVDDIGIFLDDLRTMVSARKADSQKGTLDLQDVAHTQHLILTGGMELPEDGYSGLLSEWVLSSEPFRSSGSGGVGATFSHSFDAPARSRSSTVSAKRLVYEARRCRKILPRPTANSSIFVCFAEERMDLCRVLVSGPVDTPYAHGLFEFDVYFPPTFPAVPPLVTFMTTGGGKVRFNPNLYVDGKVCISLLGVTNATTESQRWNPAHSSLAQIMISIQSQILGVQEPYYNEGNGVPERMRLTAAGQKGSSQYNNAVKLATLRYAIIQNLRYAPKGFEEVTLRHFALCRRRIVVQARVWMLEARGTDLLPRYERSYAELLSLLWTERTRKYGSLAPLQEDLKKLEKLDQSLCPDRGICDHNTSQERKPSACDSCPYPDTDAPVAARRAGHPTVSNRAPDASPFLASALASDANPWANQPSAGEACIREQTFHDEDDSSSDDEIYK